MDTSSQLTNIRISVRLSTVRLALNRYKQTKKSYYLDEARRQIWEAEKIAMSLLHQEYMTDTNKVGFDVLRDEIHQLESTHAHHA